MTKEFKPPFYFAVECFDPRPWEFSNLSDHFSLNFTSEKMYFGVLLDHVCCDRTNDEFIWHEPAPDFIEYRTVEWKHKFDTEGTQHHCWLGTNTPIGEKWASLIAQRDVGITKKKSDEVDNIFSNSVFGRAVRLRGMGYMSSSRNYRYLPKLIAAHSGIEEVQYFCNKLDERFAIYPYATLNQLPDDIELCRFIVEDEASIDDVVEMMLPKREYSVDGKVKLSF